MRVTVLGTNAEVRPLLVLNALFAISVIPLGISARPVHPVLAVKIFAFTVKVPLTLQAIVPLGTAVAGAAVKSSEEIPMRAVSADSFLVIRETTIITRLAPLLTLLNLGTSSARRHGPNWWAKPTWRIASSHTR